MVEDCYNTPVVKMSAMLLSFIKNPCTNGTILRIWNILNNVHSNSYIEKLKGGSLIFSFD